METIWNITLGFVMGLIIATVLFGPIIISQAQSKADGATFMTKTISKHNHMRMIWLPLRVLINGMTIEAHEAGPGYHYPGNEKKITCYCDCCASSMGEERKTSSSYVSPNR